MPDIYVRQSPRTAWRVYDGEAVILWPDDSTLNTLNAVGTLIWEAADGTRALSAIVARICEEFEVDAERAERDAMAFVAKLRARGLLTVSETIQSAPEESTWNDATSGRRSPLPNDGPSERTNRPRS
jgi:Coenzyme PQQ synthesis protein D (PqqD)